MVFSFPPAFWIALGFFLGIMVFNKRFRQEVDRMVARMMGRKAKPTENKLRCSMCGKTGAMALTFSEDRAICRSCTEKVGALLKEDAVRGSKRGMHVRDTWFDD